MKLVKILSTRLTGGVRFIKFLRMGKKDVQDCKESMPFGVDSVPIKDMIAVYANTSENGNPVIIGYLNKNQIADIGDYRTYSTDENGVVQTYIHLKNDGIMEIGGTGDNMIRFTNTKAVTDEFKSDLNTLKTAISGWVPVANDGGAALKAALATWFATPIAQSIDASKIDEIKTS